MPWEEIEADPEFAAMPTERRARIKRNYFEREIAPRVPKEEFESVRASFFGEEPDQPEAGPLDRAISAAKEIGAGLIEGAGHSLPGRGYRGLATGAKSLIEGEGLSKASERATETVREEYQPQTWSERVGATGGYLAANAPVFLGLGAVAPSFIPAGAAGLARLGVARAAHGAATFGAFEAGQEAAEQAIKPEPFDPAKIARRGAGGAGLGAGLGAAGMVTPVLAARGVAKGLMARLAGSAAEAGVGGAAAAVEGGEPEDVASNAVIFGFLGFLGNRQYDARFRQGVKNDIINEAVAPMVQSGMPAEAARAKASAELDIMLMKAGYTVERMKSSPQYESAARQIADRILAENPELGERAMSQAKRSLDEAIAQGEVPISELAKVKVEVAKPAEPKPEALPESAQPTAEPLPEPIREIMNKTGITDPEVARSLAEPPRPAQPAAQAAEGGPIAPPPPSQPAETLESRPGEPEEVLAEDGDASFFEPAFEAAQAPATTEELAAANRAARAPVTELSPAELERRFPGITPEQQERLIIQAVQKGHAPSEEAISKFEGVRTELEESDRPKASRKVLTPIIDFIKKSGGLDRDSLKGPGAGLGELRSQDLVGKGANPRLRGLVSRKGQFKGLDHAAEALKEAGLLPERDINLLLERLFDESRALAGGAEPAGMVAEPKGPGYQAVRMRKPVQAPMPEETAATLERAGIKAGSEVVTIRRVNDPIFGQIKKGASVKVLATDLEGGNVLIEHGEVGLLGKRPIAVIPVRALAEPVTTAPATMPKPKEVAATVARETGVRPEMAMANVTEAVALREKLKAEARGAKTASALERIQARKEIAKAIGEQILLRKHAAFWDDIRSGIRKRIVEYARMALPLERRGLLLSKAANARNINDMAQAFYAIEQEASKVLSKDLDHDIKTILERVLNDKAFPVPFRKMMREAVSDFRMQNWSERTIEILRSQQEFIDHLKQTGENISVPRAVLDQVALLAKQPLSEIPNSVKEKILLDLQTIASRGYDVADIRAENKLARLVSELSELRPATSGIVSPSYKAGMPIDPLAGVDWAQKNARDLQAALDFFQNAGLSINPMMEIFKKLDGGNPDGAWRRIVYDPINRAYSVILSEFGHVMDRLDRAIKSDPMTEQEWKELGAFFMREQDGGIEKLSQIGIPEARARAITLSPKQEKFLWLRDWFNDDVRFNEFAKVLDEEWGIEISKIKNYWRMATDEDAYYDSYEAAVRVGMEWRGLRVNPEMGMTKERLPEAKQKVELHALKVFRKGVLDQLWVQHMGREIRHVRDLVNDEEVKARLGDVGYLIVKEWEDVLSHAGGASGAGRIRVLDWMLRNMGASVLGLRPHAPLIQLTSLFHAASRIGYMDVMRGMQLAVNSDWIGMLSDHAPKVMNRGGNYPEVNNVLAGGNMSWWNRFTMQGIVSGDSFAARSAYIGAYVGYCKKHGLDIDPKQPNPDALRHADWATTLTQGSPHVLDMALAVSRGKLLGGRGHITGSRILLQYQNFALFNWSNFKDLVVEVGEGPNKLDAAEGVAWSLAGTLSAAGIRWGSNIAYAGIALALGAISAKQYEKIEKRNKFSEKAMRELLTMPPLMGTIMSMAATQRTGLPLIDTLKDLFGGLSGLGDGVYKGKPIAAERGLINALTAAASLGGVGGASFIGQQLRKPLYGKRDKKSRNRKRGSWL